MFVEVSLRQKGMNDLQLGNNQFHGGEGVQFAVDVLKNNSSLTEFYWGGNSFHSTEDACKLFDAISEHPTIGCLTVKSSLEGSLNGIPYSPVKHLFGGIWPDTLRDVTLNFNGIETNGDRRIPDFLSGNPPLEYLNFEGNRLTDDDALSIALALQSNTNLRYLDLRNNLLTTEGKIAMRHQSAFGLDRSDLLASRSVSEANLSVVSEANHTCEIGGISSCGCGSSCFCNNEK